MSDYHQYVTTLAGRKLAAWAFAVGERPRYLDDAFRPRLHRGILSDVDFDRVVPDPRHRPLLARLTDLLRRVLRRPAAEATAEARLRGTLIEAVGERLAAAYIGEDQTSDAAIRTSGDVMHKTNRSRAA